ncbi:hypothetical protein V2J09_000838 [Rumex salicifolius]
MGIKDLLRFMKPYTEAVHIEKYGGKRVGIDAYSWLHKGAYSCSMEICLDSDSDAKYKYIRYFMHRIDMLRHYNVVPVVVFDGGNVACKAATEDERYRRRQTNRELAMEKLREGNVSAATELFQRAISITTSMAHQLIQTLRVENVEFMVAPYEADAQLAYLSNLGEEKGGIEAVITEDSDLLAYGCSSVIFKMDRYGNGEEILLEKVFNSTNRKPSFQNFNRDLFTGMCVLAGCDFLPSIPGIGIGKAHSLVSKYYNIDRALSVLKFGKCNQMPEDYLRSFRQAVAVFQHARVYDKITKRIQHIKPLDEELLHALDGELDFLGSDLHPSMATAISEGVLDPMTMEAYDFSQKARTYQPNPSFKKKEATIAATTGSCFAAARLAKNVQEKEFPGNAENSCKKRKQEVIFHNLAKELAICDGNAGFKENSFLPEKTPDNNPFKRCNQVTLGLKTPLKRFDQVTLGLKTPDNNPIKKSCDQKSSALEGDDTFVQSCTTEADTKSIMFSPVLESQESVSSKIHNGNICRTRLKNSACKNSSNRTRKGTILDFFSFSS